MMVTVSLQGVSLTAVDFYSEETLEPVGIETLSQGLCVRVNAELTLLPACSLLKGYMSEPLQLIGLQKSLII